MSRLFLVVVVETSTTVTADENPNNIGYYFVDLNFLNFPTRISENFWKLSEDHLLKRNIFPTTTTNRRYHSIIDDFLRIIFYLSLSLCLIYLSVFLALALVITAGLNSRRNNGRRWWKILLRRTQNKPLLSHHLWRKLTIKTRLI